MDVHRNDFLHKLGLTSLAGFSFSYLLTRAFSRRKKTIKERLKQYRDQELVFVSWGGTVQAAIRKAYLAPFEKEFGVKIIEDSPVDYGKVKAMVQSNNVTWDVIQADTDYAINLGKMGFFEKLDYSIIDTTDIIEYSITDWSVGTLFWSTILAYRTDVFPTGNAPTSMADFWDIKKFPGNRSMRDSPEGNIPIALVADGVPLEQIYPITAEKVDRAFRKLNEVKPYITTWWTQSTQPVQLLTDKEVVMSIAWNGRIRPLQEENVPVGVVWNGGQLRVDGWAIPKGSRKRELATLFIAWASLPENNVRLSKYNACGPTNKKSIEMIPENIAATLPTSPQNMQVQVMSDPQWWADNLPRMHERWNKWRLS